jgi:hypothetical protein
MKNFQDSKQFWKFAGILFHIAGAVSGKSKSSMALMQSTAKSFLLLMDICGRVAVFCSPRMRLFGPPCNENPSMEQAINRFSSSLGLLIFLWGVDTLCRLFILRLGCG